MGSLSIQISNIPDINERVYSFDLAGETCLFDVLDAWCAQNAPGTLDKIIDPQTRLVAATTLVTVNGRSVKSDDPKTTMAAPGDSIYVTKIIVGG